MIVADASVVIVALVDEGPEGELARSRLTSEPAAAPELLYAEVAFAVRRLEGSGQLTSELSSRALESLIDMPLRIAGHRDLVPRCWELRHNITAYDGLYVALAEASDAVLVTSDARLARAVGPRCRIELLNRS